MLKLKGNCFRWKYAIFEKYRSAISNGKFLADAYPVVFVAPITTPSEGVFITRFVVAELKAPDLLRSVVPDNQTKAVVFKPAAMSIAILLTEFLNLFQHRVVFGVSCSNRLGAVIIYFPEVPFR